jgi:hypothetical protein
MFRDNLSVSSSRQQSWTAWPLKMGPIGCYKTSVTTNLRCVTSQKSEYLTSRRKPEITRFLMLVEILSDYGHSSNTLSFFPSCKRRSFKSVQDSTQNYSSTYLCFYEFRQKMEKMPWISSALNLFLNLIFVLYCCPKYLNFAPLAQNLLGVLILWFCPGFCSRDMDRCLDFSTHFCVNFRNRYLDFQTKKQ